MIWIIIAVAAVIILGGFIYAAWQGKVIFTSGGGNVAGPRETKIVKRTRRSVAVPIDMSQGAGTSLDKLPPAVRAQFEKMMAEGRTSAERITVNINGEKREYSSMDEMPQDLRERFQAETGKIPVEGKEIILTIDGRTYRYNSIEEVPPEWRIFLSRGGGDARADYQ